MGRRCRLSDEVLTVYMAPNDCGHPRVGVSVKRSNISAAGRNRLKRLLRETFRLNQHKIPQPFDYLLMISPQALIKTREGADINSAAKKLRFEKVNDSFLTLVKQLKKMAE